MLQKPNSFLSHENPWKRYRGVWEKEQAGVGVVAYENVLTFPVVFIKQKHNLSSKEQLESLKEVRHNNIVHLKQVFLSDASIFFVYEAMRMSLAQLRGSPYVSFNEPDIATVCKEVLVNQFCMNLF